MLERTRSRARPPVRGQLTNRKASATDSTAQAARSRRWLFHPLLLGVYFVLTLAASNAAAVNGWRELLWPAWVSLAVSILFWAIGFALTRDEQRASLLAVLWVVAFSVFGYVAETLRPGGTLTLIGKEPGLGGLFALALFGPSLAVGRTRRHLEPVNRYLTLVAAILVGYTAIQLVRSWGDDREQPSPLPVPINRHARVSTEDLPDIYLIILDKYTSSEVLKEHFGYDNSGFDTFLRGRGFAVPRHARANYPRTQLSLASMLNLDYVQNLPLQRNLDALIEDNRLAAFLKQQGYRFVFFPTPFKFTSHNRNADLQLPPPAEVKGEFRAAWARTTLLPELVRGGCTLLRCRAERWRPVAETADLMDWKFERLAELAGGQQPTFVLAHLVLPHEPFLYRADCRQREPYWPLNTGVMGDKEATQGYLDEISCANRKLSALVDSILSRSRRPPVILLQSDHGHGRLGRSPSRLPSFNYVDAYRLKERMSAFAAYLLPGLDSASVGDSITPVNAIRLTLRHYFGADLPMLEDASYWSSQQRQLEFTRIRW